MRGPVGAPPLETIRLAVERTRLAASGRSSVMVRKSMAAGSTQLEHGFRHLLEGPL